MSTSIQRFVALDVHKHYLVVAAVNAHKETVLHPRRLSLSRFPDWAAKHLKPSDAVVIEATTNAWHVFDIVQPLVAKAVVAHPFHVKLIAAAQVKTDKIDTLTLEAPRRRFHPSGLGPSSPRPRTPLPRRSPASSRLSTLRR